MASIRGRLFVNIVRAVANVNPDYIKEKNKDLIKNLRGMEKTFKTYIPPIGYKVEKDIVSGLPIELFKKKSGGNDKLIFVAHGGAYVTRMAFIYRWMNKTYSKASGGGSVLHFDYRCSPEYKYPCALEDAVKAWDWALEHGFKEENIITIGDSAGGNLSVALLMKLNELGKKMPRASVVMSPWLDMTASGKSYKENYAVDPLFGIKGQTPTDADVERLLGSELFNWYGDEDPKNPYVSPVYAEFDSSYPTMLITVGGIEMLLSDSQTLYEKMKNAGVDVTLDVTPGMFHVFNLYRLFPESLRAVKLVNEFIGKQFSHKAEAVQVKI